MNPRIWTDRWQKRCQKSESFVLLEIQIKTAQDTAAKYASIWLVCWKLEVMKVVWAQILVNHRDL